MVQDVPNTIFLAGDEAGLYLQATTCHVWSPTGQTPIVRADPGRAKTNFYGALNLQSGQEAQLSAKGRHDTCIALRVPVVVEAITAMVLADLMLLEGKIGRIF